MKSLMHSERPRRLHLCFISFTGLMQVIFLVILFLFVCSFSSLEVNRLGVNLNFDVKLKFLVLMVVKQNLKIWLKCNCNSKKTGAKKKKKHSFYYYVWKKKTTNKTNWFICLIYVSMRQRVKQPSTNTQSTASFLQVFTYSLVFLKEIHIYL